MQERPSLTHFTPIETIRAATFVSLRAAMVGIVCVCLMMSALAFAQEDTSQDSNTQISAEPQTDAATDNPDVGLDAISDATADAAPDAEPIEETDEQIAAMIDKKVVRIRILDKITATTRNFNLDVGQTVSYGDLRIKPQACRKSPPTAEPEAAAFLEVWEILAKNPDPQWVFSGWMFASTPGLSAMDHPIYDVWVIDCLDSRKEPQPVAVDKPDAVDEKPEDGAPSEEFPDLGD